MRFIAMALCLVLLAAPVSANHVGLYAGPGPGSCLATPLIGSVTNVYIVQHGSSAVTATSFRVNMTLPANMIAVGHVPVGYICIADCNPYEGVYVGNRDCSSDDWVTHRLDFISFAPLVGGACDALTVAGHPDSDVLVYDCDTNPQVASGGFFSFVTNPGECEDCITATEQSTWGRVKALYR